MLRILIPGERPFLTVDRIIGRGPYVIPYTLTSAADRDRLVRLVVAGISERPRILEVDASAFSGFQHRSLRRNKIGGLRLTPDLLLRVHLTDENWPSLELRKNQIQSFRKFLSTLSVRTVILDARIDGLRSKVAWFESDLKANAAERIYDFIRTGNVIDDTLNPEGFPIGDIAKASAHVLALFDLADEVLRQMLTAGKGNWQTMLQRAVASMIVREIAKLDQVEAAFLLRAALIDTPTLDSLKSLFQKTPILEIAESLVRQGKILLRRDTIRVAPLFREMRAPGTGTLQIVQQALETADTKESVMRIVREAVRNTLKGIRTVVQIDEMSSTTTTHDISDTTVDHTEHSGGRLPLPDTDVLIRSLLAGGEENESPDSVIIRLESAKDAPSRLRGLLIKTAANISSHPALAGRLFELIPTSKETLGNSGYTVYLGLNLWILHYDLKGDAAIQTVAHDLAKLAAACEDTETNELRRQVLLWQAFTASKRDAPDLASDFLEQALSDIDDAAHRIELGLQTVTLYTQMFLHDEAERLVEALVSDEATQSHPLLLADLRLLQGQVLYQRFRYDEARSAVDDALTLYRNARFRFGEANCLKSIGDLEIRVDHFDDAERSYKNALSIFREIKERLCEANCLRRLGDLQMRTDRLDRAGRLYETALPIYQELKERLGEANCYRRLGDLRMRADRIDNAERFYETALPIYQELKERLGEANCLKSLGDLQMRADRINDAGQSYEKALFIYEEISASLGEANCLKSLGDFQLRVDRLNDAERSYERAMAINKKINSRRGEADCLRSLGDLQLRLGRCNEAVQSFEASLTIYREIDSRLGEADCLKGLGDLQLRANQLDDAGQSYESALSIYKEIVSRLGEANCLQGLGDLYLRTDRLDEAERTYESALSFYKKVDSRLGEANCLHRLGDLQRRMTRFDAARSSHGDARRIYQEITNRQGEANCLQGLGLLALAEGFHQDAFSTFLDVLRIYQDIHGQLGEEAALRYLARVALSVEESNRALLLAEESLKVGRRVNDRLGQIINLKLQLAIWMENEAISAQAATLVLLADLERQISEPTAEARADMASQMLDQLPEEARSLVLSNPEEVRQRAIQAVRERFQATGRDLFVLS